VDHVAFHDPVLDRARARAEVHRIRRQPATGAARVTLPPASDEVRFTRISVGIQHPDVGMVPSDRGRAFVSVIRVLQLRGELHP
jgi:hypothetical protein